MPKQTPELPLPAIQLDTAAVLPLHRQLYEQLSQAIRAGDLKPGTRLPSTRALALELGVSRTTTIGAYNDLRAEGYIESLVGVGTVVTQRLPEPFFTSKRQRSSSVPASETNEKATPEPLQPPLSQPPLSQWGSRLATLSAPSWFTRTSPLRPFRLGVPALEATPHQSWARTITQTARQAAKEQLDYQPAAGYYPLRSEIAAYLAVARGVRCNAEQVLITTGIQGGLSLITQLLLNPQDPVWIEDPGYFLAQVAFQAAGVSLAPIAVDREGLNVADGIARCPQARLAYVTPSHQFPLGVTMSHSRRRELLQWAQEANAWIVEDDYDSEFRYSGRPIPALQGLDESGRVIYLGTFSKVFFPALRLGYLVVPPPLIDHFAVAQRVMSFHPPALEQAAMATFMAEGHFTRHIRRMRGIYAKRRDVLLRWASHYLADRLQLERAPSGLHTIGWLPDHVDEQEMVQRANQQGVTVYPLSAFRLGEPGRKGVVLGFAAFNEEEIKEGVQKLAQAWGRS